MCGIVSYYSKSSTPIDSEISLNLIKQSKIRGLHSFGISKYLNGSIHTDKYFDLKDIDPFKTNAFIYHNRYSTSGDFKIINNNQPITIKDISISMNGVISMKSKDEYEREYNISCSTENDSEIFIHLLKENRISELNGSYAIVWLQNNDVYAIRNNKRPLYYFRYKDSIWFCSTIDIIKRALSDMDISVKIHNTIPGNKYSSEDLLW